MGSAATYSTLNSLRQPFCLRCPWAINHRGNKKWTCRTHSLSRGGLKNQPPLYQCVVIRVCRCVGKTRPGCVQIIGMSDYLKVNRRVVFHADTPLFVFTSLQCLSGPTCFCDCSLHCVRVVIERLVGAWSFHFGNFLFCPPTPILPGGLLEVYRTVTVPRSPLKKKTWLSDPQSPSFFLLNTKNMCALWVHVLRRK